MEQSKKFLLVLPLIVIPFVIALFVILGGGGNSDPAESRQKPVGLNVKLPDAHFKRGKEKNKLLLYEEAGRDSAMLKEKMKKDPNYVASAAVMDENEAKITEKLELLKSIIRKDESRNEKTGTPERDWQPAYQGKQIQKPEALMAAVKNSRVSDPQVEQISAMLDKVMAIQHPELMRDSMSRLAVRNRPPAYAVSLEEEETGVTNAFMINRFYDLADDLTIEGRLDNSIEAVVSETQVLVSGSTMKLQLLNDVRINGRLIMKNQFIYGAVSVSGDRFKISFSSVRAGNNILPVSLEAFDMDGLAGVYIPGSINRDVAKQSGDQALGAIGVTSLDQSIGAQAAGAGIQAAKTLLGRKAKLVKVTIKAGYKLLLKDAHS